MHKYPLKPNVLLHTDKPEASTDVLRSAHPDIEIHTCSSYKNLPSAIERSKAEVIYTVRFAGTEHFPRKAMLEAQSVKWVSIGGSGSDHMTPWDPEHVIVTNAAGVAASMMAEYVLGCLLAFRLNLRQFHEAQHQQRWLAGTVQPIQGSTILILGLGHTGRAVAKISKSLGMQVLGTRANPQPTEHVDEVHALENLHALLPRADAIVCCVPLLESTRQLLSEQQFKLMQSTSILIDVSRGGVIDQTALIQALQKKQIAGAALDVFEQEPLPAEHPLWNMDNAILTPHCSSVYEGWELKSVSMFAENLKRYRSGETLHNLVDPKRGY